MKAFAIVAAGGSGRRMGGADKKQFLSLGGVPLIVQTVRRLEQWDGFAGIVLVVPGDDVERVRGMMEGAGIRRLLMVVPGGAERQDSVRLGLAALQREAVVEADSVVFVHDGARPFPPIQRFAELLQAAHPDGALLALPCRDTIKREAESTCVETVARDGLWLAQTPQVFPFALLEEALAAAAREGRAGTDEAALVEALGRRPRLVQGAVDNFKVTWPEDLNMAEALHQPQCAPLRWAVGHGYDVHRLVADRKLVLGGVEIAHPLGLLGHSDADVLTHAVADACLGAAGLGDIGRWFPDNESKWKGACSIDLLREVRRLLDEQGAEVCRVDATLIAQRPRLAPHLGTMQDNLSLALQLPSGGVSVKATTTEMLGFEGREEGISAHAVALLRAG